ncbi:MAG TPA: RNA pyrophosphohydrolase [Gammaproteobacteria bacterium]|nr:RNA pyrophosphohydrolase [Gammaproteobacteria bacterium]
MERVTESIDREGFRANVGIILSRDGGEVLWARCVKNRGWQFPQGGIDVGETAEEALFRELYEELGLGAGDVRITGYTEGWLRYRLPETYQRKHASPRCVGQKQVWYVLRLISPETTIRLTAVDHPEFDRWRWVDWWHPLSDVIFFKRRVYDQALTQLAPFMFPEGPPPRPGRQAPAGWYAPRSPYHIRRGAQRRESRSQSETARELR